MFIFLAFASFDSELVINGTQALLVAGQSSESTANATASNTGDHSHQLSHASVHVARKYHYDALQSDSEPVLLKSHFSRAFDAFHAAEAKGLFAIQLKDVFEAPLAQRRHHKRSTSSNASSESTQSTNSMCSSLSTSTTSMNTTSTANGGGGGGGASSSQLIHSYVNGHTPTKKCPLSCGKPSERTVFNFNDSYVSEYLSQQQQLSLANAHQVFNRPITRSLTHHNNKLGVAASGTGTDATLNADTAANANATLSNASSQIFTFPSVIAAPSATTSSSTTTTISQPVVAAAAALTTAVANAMGSLSAAAVTTLSAVNTQGTATLASGAAAPTTPVTELLAPPACKRMKRCSTIMID